MPIAALYLRVSTTSGEQLQALEQQRQRLLAAVPDGFEPAIYEDVLSGKEHDRPAFTRLMADVSKGAVAMVLATRLDRLSRNRKHGAEILDAFSADGAPRLQLLDDHLDLASVGGRLMAGILSAWAIAESERIGERTAWGHAHRRKLGKPFGPQAPRGYVWNADRSNYDLAPDADLYRAIVDRFQADPIIRPTVRWAAETGISFSSPSAFVRWINNPALAGARVYGVSTMIKDPETGKPRRRHNKPGVYGQVLWDAHPALITREQHAWIVSHFATNRAQATAPLRDGRIRLATGLAVCSHCGRRLNVHQSGSHAPRYYRCSHQHCEQRYRNRVRESEIIEAACLRMLLETEELSRRAAEVLLTDQLAEPEEARQLRCKIEAARGLNDPCLETGINQMEARLELLLRQSRTEPDVDIKELRRFFADGETWQRLIVEEPAALRGLLLSMIVGVQVRSGAVEGVVTRGDMAMAAKVLAAAD